MKSIKLFLNTPGLDESIRLFLIFKYPVDIVFRLSTFNDYYTLTTLLYMFGVMSRINIFSYLA
jgi:hypothetical protein